MAKDKQPPAEEAQGAPEWMMTFSDCMTLLLTFFVLLLSFSSFDELKFRRVTTSIANAMPAVGLSRRDKQSFMPPQITVAKEQIDKGSEKPTLEDKFANNLRKEDDVDFQSRKVFVSNSSDVFWGRGAVLSSQGRELLSLIADYLKLMPNNVVISERSVSGLADTDTGISRALNLIEHLCSVYGFSSKRFSVSADGGFAKLPTDFSGKRIVEIVLLERAFSK